MALRFKASYAGSTLVVLASSLYLYCFAFFPPFIPVFRGLGDDLLYLAPAPTDGSGRVDVQGLL